MRNFKFETPLGSLTVSENSYHTDEQLHNEAIILAHCKNEPVSHLTPLQYGRLLLKTNAVKSDGTTLSTEELEQITKEKINDFAEAYCKMAGFTVTGDPLVALYHYAIRLEHFYHLKAEQMKSPFSRETTLSSLHSTDQPLESHLRHYWQHHKEGGDKPLNQRLSDLLSLKKSVEQVEQPRQVEIADIYDILTDQNNSQFKRDVETKKTVNRNFILAIVALVVGLSNLFLNILRYVLQT